MCDRSRAVPAAACVRESRGAARTQVGGVVQIP